MNNGGTRLTNFVCSPLFLRPTSPVCGLVLPCYSIPRLLARCHLMCAFEVETQLKYKNTKFESSAKTHFLVFSWVYTSLTSRRNGCFSTPRAFTRASKCHSRLHCPIPMGLWSQLGMNTAIPAIWRPFSTLNHAIWWRFLTLVSPFCDKLVRRPKNFAPVS